MNMPVVVLGAGGHAKVLINALQLCNVEILGITDPDPTLLGQELLGVPVIGTDEVLKNYSIEKVHLVNGLGTVDLSPTRAGIFNDCNNLGFVFAQVIHPMAVVAGETKLGEGVQVMAGAVIQPGSFVGCNSIINTRASVDHDCTIGSHVHIAPGVTLSGGVTVGACSHIGTGATLIQGVSVGTGCLVAAGAVVVKDISAGVMVRGVPAREFV